jgi:hypothetical protein
MPQAQIVDGVVHWIATDSQAAAYPPNILHFVGLPGGSSVQEGWLYNAATGTFRPPPTPPAATPAP